MLFGFQPKRLQTFPVMIHIAKREINKQINGQPNEANAILAYFHIFRYSRAFTVIIRYTQTGYPNHFTQGCCASILYLCLDTALVLAWIFWVVWQSTSQVYVADHWSGVSSCICGFVKKRSMDIDHLTTFVF